MTSVSDSSFLIWLTFLEIYLLFWATLLHLSSPFLPSASHAGKLFPSQRTPSVLLNLAYLLLSLPLSLSAWPQFTGKLTSIALSVSLTRCSCVELQANVCEQHKVYVCVSLWSMFVVCVCLWDLLFFSPLSVLNSQAALNPPSFFFFSSFLSFLSLFTAWVCLSHQVYFVLSLRLKCVRKWKRERNKQGEWEGGCPSCYKARGENKINCNQGNNTKILMQKTAKMSVQKVCPWVFMCVYVWLWS